MTPGDGRPYGNAGVGSTAAWRRLPPVVVDLSHVTTTQPHVLIGALVNEPAEPVSGDELPHVVAYNGRLYLEDGHTRCTRRWLRGERYIVARVATVG